MATRTYPSGSLPPLSAKEWRKLGLDSHHEPPPWDPIVRATRWQQRLDRLARRALYNNRKGRVARRILARCRVIECTCGGVSIYELRELTTDTKKRLCRSCANAILRT